MNGETGLLKEVIFEHPEVDVAVMGFSPKRRVPIFIKYSVEKPMHYFLDPFFQELHSHLQARLGAAELEITSINLEEDRFLVETRSDRSHGKCYFYNLQSDDLRLIQDFSPWFREKDLSRTEPIQYAARDGLVIHGYLTFPRGKGRSNLPVIVYPHGGPWTRDHWEYNDYVQFFANRGYAVFQMNYRGSRGYGFEFMKAGFKQWGHAMQDDITDGVEWLIDEGIADPERIAIFGASYGGYAALAGVTFTPDLYAAGVSISGISNLFTFLENTPPYWEKYRPMLKSVVGDPESDVQLLWNGSPYYFADQIEAPLLMFHGSNDPRTTIVESDQIVEALRARGADVVYIVKEDEGHGFQNQENRRELFDELEAFLARHLKD